ncbi:MAG TPA: hypothetical protein DEA46_00395 [Candidatus Moranbacteria bacterium]|nr:hypothetical protein [Candidatus Moranbacteria bacterium]
MEFPAWLKLENIIKNLNFSNLFNGWFKRENIKHVKNEINIEKVISYNVVLSDNPNDKPEKINQNNPIFQKIESVDQQVFEFTSEESFLLVSVNKIHVLCGRSDFNFEKNYKQALNHIRKKLTSDWYECAAKDMVQVKESIDFFSAFMEPENPEKKDEFKKRKENINYLYGIIQEIKHSNKRGNIEEKFLSPYDKRLNNNNVMTNEKYEGIFKDFQISLVDLFKEFKLKD